MVGPILPPQPRQSIRRGWISECRLIVRPVEAVQLDERVSEMVSVHVAAVMGPEVSPESVLSDLGLGSLGAHDLRMRLGVSVDSYLPLNWMSGAPTPGAVTGQLVADLRTRPAAKSLALVRLLARPHRASSLVSAAIGSPTNEAGMLFWRPLSDDPGVVVRLCRFLAMVEDRDGTSISVEGPSYTEVLSLLGEAGGVDG